MRQVRVDQTATVVVSSQPIIPDHVAALLGVDKRRFTVKQVYSEKTKTPPFAGQPPAAVPGPTKVPHALTSLLAPRRRPYSQPAHGCLGGYRSCRSISAGTHSAFASLAG